ncbi:NAD-dependent epimerase/dehydratase family protein [Paraliomyxa miuraensis]|uniref:NAD-dependent epimerase/dehydratase family protein n=1 Tax=Paraliomyxa miuraensis TaxID=376150 RepID=UPI002254F698|nr:NAD-dependent epimerase/dehydratase family protein [Paraliomyxa miuraensis]MCX4243387.1 NAD-dependent epimerase/dehydratase family protein [Paraliomyxa miuraensis]
MRALVIGGTGPTGPAIVSGLLERGYAVTILHRGVHEHPGLPEVEHIHADPHFRESIAEALSERQFDLVVATYGRLRHVARAVVGRTDRLVAVSGFPCYRGYADPEVWKPAGMRIPSLEHAPVVETEDEDRFSYLVAHGEAAVMRGHAKGRYVGTVFRYPFVYGPRQPIPREWCIIRRILDGRRHLLLPAGGLSIVSRGFALNLAHAVLLGVDRPEVAGGRIYNCGDERQLTLGQWVESIAAAMGRELEILELPCSLVACAAPLLPLDGHLHHRLLCLSRLRTELGYRDVTPVEVALPETVRHYVEHRPERGGPIEARLRDPFDYEAEDRLAALAHEWRERVRAVGLVCEGAHHAYAHPTRTGLGPDHRGR